MIIQFLYSVNTSDMDWPLVQYLYLHFSVVDQNHTWWQIVSVLELSKWL